MSEFGSDSDKESDGHTYATPFPATRRNGPFLGATMIHSDSDSARSLYQEDEVLSQSTRFDDQSGEPVPTTSTPDLSFDASSSPLLFSTRDSPNLHATDSGNVASRSKLTSDHTVFVRRLDYLLQQAADQQCHSRISDDIRIQPNSPEEVSGPASQMESMGHDVILESAPGQREYNRRLSPSLSEQSRRSSSLHLRGSTSNDNRLASPGAVASINSRRNKRKAKDAVDEGSESSSTSFFRDGNPSDSYLSASDGDSSKASRCLAGRHPPSKKRRCLSLDIQLSVVSSCADSSAFSDANLIISKSLPFQAQQGSETNATHDGCKGDVTPSRSPISSVAGSVLSYPSTQLNTPVLGLSPELNPVPVLDPQYFSQADIPSVFLSSDDAARARLMSLLRKEVFYCREEGLGSLLALEFASTDTLEVTAWILAVEPPLGSPTAVSIRGRAHSYDLHKQLTDHHDSRFLAAYIFSLFFFISARGDSKNPLELDQSETIHVRELNEGKDTDIWNYAVAAIALAVKMHRDNYPPFKPIFANHFLALARHAMSFEDLEMAQRTLLQFFSYDLGMPTPQAFLDELRVALPTLRQALKCKHEWADVSNETWKQLIAAARWPSMLGFRVSLLTATALIEAIKRVIRCRLSAARTCDCPTTYVAPGVALQGNTMENEYSDLESATLRATRAVSEDIRKVLGLSTERTDECEKWLRSPLEKPVRSKYFPGSGQT